MFFHLLDLINDFVALFVVVPLIFCVGLYLSIRIGFIQITKLKKGFWHLLNPDKNVKGNITHFEAISTVLAGNLGTGNISGMAVALATGGPGALAWMWVMAFLGAILKFAGCLLGVKYRHINPEGEYVGGAMYFLDQRLKLRKMAWIFSFFAVLTAFSVGNLVQVNSISLPIESMGFHPLYFSILIAVSVGIVLLGGVQRVALVASTVVPLMAFLYLLVASIILVKYIDHLPAAFSLILTSAMGWTPVAGGALGFGVLKAVTVGFSRGVFATDAGVGIAPILQASAQTKNPVVEGIVAMVAPIVVMFICTITTLVLLVTNAWTESNLQSTNMCLWAFQKGLGHEAGSYVVLIALILFAFTTILAWAYCAEKAVEYLWGLDKVKWFQYLFIAVIPIGALSHVDLVWKLADVCMAIMLLANVVGIIGLSKEVIADSRACFKVHEE